MAYDVNFDKVKRPQETEKKPHADFAKNKFAAKRFIDQLLQDPLPGVSAHMSDIVFFVEAYRGKAKYSWPISLNQSSSEMGKDIAAALGHCKEFAEHNRRILTAQKSTQETET